MKQIIFSIVFLAFAMCSATAQDSLHYKMYNPGVEQSAPGHSLKFSREYFLQKSIKCKVAAWVMLSSGAALIIAGSVVLGDEPTSSTGYEAMGTAIDAELGAAAVLIGGGMAVGSIPLFVASGHYKKKAMKMSMSFKMQPYHELEQSSMTTKFTPGVGLKINF